VRPSLIRALAAIVVAAIVSACSGGAAPSTAPVATGPAGSPLPAGTYTSKAFTPAVTYTLPAGWQNIDDLATYLSLNPFANDAVGIHFFKDPPPMSQATGCPSATEVAVGTSSADLVKWIRARPGLTVSQPAIATIDGLPATQIDVRIIDGWTDSCPFANGIPTVPLFYRPGTDGYRWVIAGSERLRLYFVDVPGVGLVVVDIDAFDGSQFDALAQLAKPIVDSLKIARP
jgi:hypothetical protein